MAKKDDVSKELEQLTAEETSKKSNNKKSPEKSDDASKPKKGGVSRYFKDLTGEFKKIVWPSKKQVINNTIVVIIFCLIMGGFVALVDLALSNTIGLPYKNAPISQAAEETTESEGVTGEVSAPVTSTASSAESTASIASTTSAQSKAAASSKAK